MAFLSIVSVSLLVFSSISNLQNASGFSSIQISPPIQASHTIAPRSNPLICKQNMSCSISDDISGHQVRYLGSGPDAIIRPGVVLVAPKHEYDHFLMKSAVFVYAIGLDDNQDMVIRGVIVDHPTAFTVGEMSPDVMGKLSKNVLFRGGNSGSDSAMLFHSAGGTSGPIRSGEMIGSSGLYQGEIVSAMESVDSGIIDPSRCKFFFNYMQFREVELEKMFSTEVEESHDAWVSLEVPPEYVLDSNLVRGQMWSRLRDLTRKYHRAE